MTQFKSSNFTPAESVSLSKELALIGVQSTPLTSILLSKGSVEKAMATVHTWIEKTLDTTEDISAVEGAETTVFQASVRRELNNILQIFKKAVSISGTADAMKRDQFPSEVADRLLELKINLEGILLNGIKDDGSVTGVRKMSGLQEFADASNDVSGFDTDVEKVLQDGMERLWNQNLLDGEYYWFVDAGTKRFLDRYYKDAYGYTHKETNFGLIVNTVNTNFGLVNVVMSKHITEGKTILFNENYVDLVALREATFEPLAKTGDAERGQIVGEYTIKVGSPKAIARLTVE